MPEPLTADTITDEQIRELRQSSDAVERAIAQVAKNGRGKYRARARVRCAEILNARAEEAGSILPGGTFPTSKLAPVEIADGWSMCANPTCKPTMGKHKISGPHAHRANGGGK